jgi:hypothetical protein
MIMAVSSRASDFVNQQILGAKSAPTAPLEMEQMEREEQARRQSQLNESVHQHD